ncbi:hypothetical protein L1987_79165 [Smallanthus sonchifolius]|uniref:Uncharacterized protein n=1 Tax=Smallanthus sonchifolius TaxID=185202 RepID=A0ACB8ZEN7_9ASTR|nr:hypothetical protein L1987_79165 [Smallanthus sonchifolius]
MGTATGSGRSDEVKAAVVEAIKVGYRHFDTAAFYGTEKAVGEAIVFKSGFSEISRREESPEFGTRFGKQWRSQNLGLTKSIGVSNFTSQKIQEIVSFAKIPPVVNQVEMNPLWQQKQLNEFCKENHILLTAYSPLASAGNSWGNNSVIGCDVLQDIAKSRGKTTAQISLRWLYEQGVSFVVKSFNKERMMQNVDIFDWALTQEDLNKISQIPQRKLVYLLGFVVREPNDITAEIDSKL